MKFKNLFFIFSFILVSGFFSSCGDDCPFASNYIQGLSEEINVLSGASMNYDNDPTNENCSAYKTAYQSLIDGLLTYEDCLSGQDLVNLEFDLEAAQNGLNALPC